MPELFEEQTAKLRTSRPPTIARISDGLDLLAELKAQLDLIALQKQALIDNVLTLEIKVQLTDIDAEFADPIHEINERIAELEALIRDEVIALGVTVKSKHLMAVYVKGRVTWDGSLLDGMRRLIPQLNNARKEGDPTCIFRKV